MNSNFGIVAPLFTKYRSEQRFRYRVKSLHQKKKTSLKIIQSFWRARYQPNALTAPRGFSGHLPGFETFEFLGRTAWKLKDKIRRVHCLKRDPLNDYWPEAVGSIEAARANYNFPRQWSRWSVKQPDISYRSNNEIFLISCRYHDTQWKESSVTDQLSLFHDAIKAAILETNKIATFKSFKVLAKHRLSTGKLGDGTHQCNYTKQ